LKLQTKRAPPNDAEKPRLNTSEHMTSAHMKKFLLLLVALVLTGCASVPRPAATVTPSVQPPYEAWAKVLEKYVDDQGRVNFAGVAKDRAELDRFVAYVYDIGPNNRPELFPTPQHAMAYHLNAYNALAMHKVVETGIPQTLAGLKKVSFFAFGKVRVGGSDISLYDYENKVIRPIGDERVHVALNCMSVGCPRLPREPFLPEKLEAQLEREAKKFFNELRNVTVDEARQTVTISEILNFFPSDFLAKAPSLPAYVNRYRDVKVPENYKVEFTKYDWTINRQPGT
jgi:Protein of unknown function, DUF547